MRKRDAVFMISGLLVIWTALFETCFVLWCFYNIGDGRVYSFWEPNPFIYWIEVVGLCCLAVNTFLFLVLSIVKVKNMEIRF